MNKGNHPKVTFNVLGVENRQYQQNWQSIPHSHYFSEVIYVTEGSGSFYVQNKEHSIKRNNLILVNPHVLHTEKSSDTMDLEYIVVGVEGLELVPIDEGFTILDTYSRINRVEEIVTSMLSEYNRKEQHFESYCQVLMQLLALEIQRFHIESLSQVSTSHISQECSAVKRYIDSRYAESITLEQLADLVHWNKYYLVHSFRDAYGLSPIAYLRQQRIENSKKLLSGHDLQISEIAMSCGFSSQSYFAQTFKQLTGITPSEYREQSTLE